MSDSTRWLSPAMAASYLSVRPDALPRLVRQGKLPRPDYTLGPRSPRYDRDAIDKLMAGASQKMTAMEAAENVVKNIIAGGSRRKKAA
jgi:hypothetical protein